MPLKTNVIVLCLAVGVTGSCASVYGASSERELGMPRAQHINNRLFQALQGSQNRVVQLWLQAREADGDRRKTLESRALKLQDRLADDVKRMKTRFKTVLSLAQSRYEQALKDANPELTDEAREALKYRIRSTNAELRSCKFHFRAFKKRYYLSLAKSREEILEHKQDEARLFGECVDAVKKETRALQEAKDALAFIQKSQAYNSVEEMVEEAGDDITTQTHIKSLATIFKADEAVAQVEVNRYTQSVARMTKLLAAGDLQVHPSGYTVKELHKGVVAREDNLRAAEEVFRNSQTYEQRTSISTINHLQISLDTLNEQLKGKDGKVKRLEEEIAYLQKMIDAQFIPEVPAPKEMLDHLCDAMLGIGEVISDLGEAKKILTLIKMNNPWGLLDYACEQAYGKGLVAMLTEKAGLEKYMTNKWVKMAVEGKFDAAALKEEVARSLLPAEVVDKLDAFEQMRRDPEGYVKEAVYSEVTSMVEANPFLKETLTKAETLQRYIKEPQTLRDDLKKEFLDKAKQVGKDTALYKELEAAYKVESQKLEEVVEIQSQYAEAYAQGAATSVRRVINQSFVHQYAPKLLRQSGLTKEASQVYMDAVSAALR